MAEGAPSEIGEIAAVMADPAASYWLKEALASALDRDAFDAERDALVLAGLLTKRLNAIVERHFQSRRT